MFSLRGTYVVVSTHDDDLIGNLGLGGEFGFGQCRHVDDGAAPGSVHVRLGPGAELGALCLKTRGELVN